jgi:DNA-binding PadR family transcriptional regulator
MEPIKRFTSLVTEGNIWIYIISLAKEEEVKESEVTRLIFEKFGFLPNEFLVKTILYRLRKDGYISKEKLKGERAYKATEKGLKELDQMKYFCSNLIQKL